MQIVLVHGIYNTSRRFRVMQARFEASGHDCIVPSLKPNSGSKGLEHLAVQLKQAIDGKAVGQTGGKICLVGFSMGGLIARYYLQALGGDQVTQLFFSIATPHHGSYWAHLLPLKGVRQMRPNSGFLCSLQDGSAGLPMPCFSYWTPFDLVVLPALSSVWDKAENIKVDVWAHHRMVKDARVIGDILGKIADAEKSLK